MTAKPGLSQDALHLCPYGNSGRQRVNKICVRWIAQKAWRMLYLIKAY